MKLSILQVLAALAVTASTASAQPAPEGSHIQVFKPGEVGPYFCPSGHLRSATILAPASDGVLIVKGRNGPNGLLLMGVGGPTCIDLAASGPETAIACFKLSKASQSEIRVAVDCGKP